MIDVVIGLMAVCSAIFSGVFLILAFISKIYRRAFALFAILFFISVWGLFEYAIFLANYDILEIIFNRYILLPVMPFTFGSIALMLFLIYYIIKKKKPI